MRRTAPLRFFTESDLFSLAQGTPQLDDAMAMAIKKVASQLDFQDLVIMDKLMRGWNQTKIAEMFGLTKMAISKRVDKIGKILAPELKSFLRSTGGRSKTPKSVKAPTKTQDLGDFEDQPDRDPFSDVPSDDYFRSLEKRKSTKKKM